MGERTKIQWCDHTFNPWLGCSKVHTGCLNCYAESSMCTKMKGVKWGDHGTRVKTSDANWRKPIAWDKEARLAGAGHHVFCASLADVFEEWAGQIHDHRGATLFTDDGIASDGGMTAKRDVTLDDLRRALFALIDKTPSLVWMLLTKRPENVKRMWVPLTGITGESCPFRPNVWIGTSVSDQETADKWVPRLAGSDGLCFLRFLSLEPLVGPIDLERCGALARTLSGERLVQWVIVGGESGRRARPCHREWIESLISQCRDAEIPCFVKQLGQHAIGIDGQRIHYPDKKGGDITLWPQPMRVRQWPEKYLRNMSVARMRVR